MNDSVLELPVQHQNASKPLAFLENNPRMWLALLDSHYQVTRIGDDQLKIELALTSFTPCQLERLEDFILFRSDDATFAEFRQAVINKFEISSEKKLNQLLNQSSASGVRPSLMLRRLRPETSDRRLTIRRSGT